MTDAVGDAFALIMKNGVVHRYTGEFAMFDDLDQAEAEADGDELLLAVPFRQALWGERPTSTPERSGRRHVSALRVRRHEEVTAEEFLRADAEPPVELRGGHFDDDDDEFARRVRAVVDDEIRTGNGSNFVLHRTYHARIDARDVASELSVFRALLRAESGAYWTFLVHFPDHSLLGASPEMHLRRDDDGLMTMNPISGTYRYPPGGPDARSLREFLDDPKERNELYMVVDEELKVMADLCDGRPWVSEPQIRFMSSLAHTEYFIHGRSTLPWTSALRGSLVAPTVLGSPVESAFRMAERNDAGPRGYLGGVLAHVPGGSGARFDSAILIRTACIEATGEVAIPVGSTIVRNSEPAREAAETAAKASGVLAAFSRPAEDSLDALAKELLESRADEVADFWSRAAGAPADVLIPNRLHALVIDHEDRFTGMLTAHLEALGLRVTLQEGSPTAEQLAGADLLVLGPGPGDPNDDSDPRIASARRLARWVVSTRRIPTLAVCLSHQLVSRELGLEVRRLPRPNQGSQRRIDLFGERVHVGFYNSFSAYTGAGLAADVDVAADDSTGEVFALRTDGIIGLQFHPESILSVDGSQVLREAVGTLLARRLARS